MDGRSSSSRWWVWGILGVMTVLIVIGAMMNIFGGAGRDEGLAGNTLGATAENILDNPEDFMEQNVIVRSGIEERVSDRAFTLDAQGGLNDDLLVVSPETIEAQGGAAPGEFIFSDDDVLTVSGRVREFSIDELEQELDMDLDEEAFRDYEGKPVIVADRIERFR